MRFLFIIFSSYLDLSKKINGTFVLFPVTYKQNVICLIVHLLSDPEWMMTASKFGCRLGNNFVIGGLQITVCLFVCISVLEKV